MNSKSSKYLINFFENPKASHTQFWFKNIIGPPQLEAILSLYNTTLERYFKLFESEGTAFDKNELRHLTENTASCRNYVQVQFDLDFKKKIEELLFTEAEGNGVEYT